MTFFLSTGWRAVHEVLGPKVATESRFFALLRMTQESPEPFVRHSEPFACREPESLVCHAEPFGRHFERSEESQGKLREESLGGQREESLHRAASS